MRRRRRAAPRSARCGAGACARRSQLAISDAVASPDASSAARSRSKRSQQCRRGGLVDLGAQRPLGERTARAVECDRALVQQVTDAVREIGGQHQARPQRNVAPEATHEQLRGHWRSDRRTGRHPRRPDGLSHVVPREHRLARGAHRRLVGRQQDQPRNLGAAERPADLDPIADRERGARKDGAGGRQRRFSVRRLHAAAVVGVEQPAHAVLVELDLSQRIDVARGAAQHHQAHQPIAPGRRPCHHPLEAVEARTIDRNRPVAAAGVLAALGQAGETFERGQRHLRAMRRGDGAGQGRRRRGQARLGPRRQGRHDSRTQQAARHPARRGPALPRSGHDADLAPRANTRVKNLARRPARTTACRPRTLDAEAHR